jgi:hypothetical protein
MFDQAIQAAEAMNETARRDAARLAPALCGCKACGTAHMIAAPTLGRCADCGAEHTALDGAKPVPASRELPAAA